MTVTPGPGGFERARVSLKVVPDVSRFTDETRDALQQAGNAIEAVVNVTIDRGKISSEIREAIAEARRQSGDSSVAIAVTIETRDIATEARAAAAQARRAAESAGAAEVDVVATGNVASARDAARDLARAAEAVTPEVSVEAVATGAVDVSRLRPSGPVNVEATFSSEQVARALGDVALSRDVNATFTASQVKQALADLGKLAVPLSGSFTKAQLEEALALVKNLKKRIDGEFSVTQLRAALKAIDDSLTVTLKARFSITQARLALKEAGELAARITGTFDRGQLSESLRTIVGLQKRVNASFSRAEIQRALDDLTGLSVEVGGTVNPDTVDGGVRPRVDVVGDITSAVVDDSVSATVDALAEVTRAFVSPGVSVAVEATAEIADVAVPPGLDVTVDATASVTSVDPTRQDVDVPATADVSSATVGPDVTAEVAATARIDDVDSSALAPTVVDATARLTSTDPTALTAPVVDVTARITSVDSSTLTPPPVIDVTTRVRAVDSTAAPAPAATAGRAAPGASDADSAAERARRQLERLQDAARDIRANLEIDGLPDLERVRLEVERLRAAARRLPIDLEVVGAVDLRSILRDLARNVELQIETREAVRRAERVRDAIRDVGDEVIEITPEVRPDAIFRARQDLASITDVATDIAFNVDANAFTDLERVRLELQRLQASAGRLPIQLELEGAPEVRALLASLIRSVDLKIDTDDAERRLERVRRLQRELDLAVAFSVDDSEIERLRRELDAEGAREVSVDVSVDDDAIVKAREALRRLEQAADNIQLTLGVDGFPDLERVRQEVDRLRAAAGRLPIELELEGAANIRQFLRDLSRNVELSVQTREAEQRVERIRRLKDQLDAAIAFEANDEEIRRILQDLDRERVDIPVDIQRSSSLNDFYDDLGRLNRRYRVNVDTSGSSGGVGQLAGSLSELLDRLRELGLGLTFTQRQFLALFLIIGPLVIALAPLAATLAQVALTLGATFVASLQGGIGAIAILGSSIARLTAAYQELSEAQEGTVDGVDQAARRQEQAAISLARAQLELQKAQRSNASADTDAQRVRDDASQAVTDSQRRLAEAQARQTERIVDAELSLERAQLNARRAQERLTRARRDAVDAVDDLNDRLRSSRISELGAEGAVQRARNQLRDLARDYRTEGGDFAEAVLELQLAEERLADARLDGLATERDVTRQRAQGTNTDNVLDAQLALEDALQAEERARRESATVARNAADDIADAERSLTRAKQDEVDARVRADDLVIDSALRVRENILAVAAAQESVNQALSNGSVSNPTKTYDDLSRSARGLVDELLAQAPRLADFRRELEEEFFAPIADPFGVLFDETISVLETSLPPLARALGGAVAAFAEAFSTPAAQSALGASIDGVTSSVGVATPFITDFAEAFVRIVEAAAPFIPLLISEILELGGAFTDFVLGASDEDFSTFFSDGIEGFRTLRQIVEDSVGILKTLFVDTNQEGQNLLTVIGDLISDLDDFLRTPEGREQIIDLFNNSVVAAIQFLFVLPAIIGFLADIISISAAVGTVGIQVWGAFGAAIDNTVLRPLATVASALETIYDFFVLLANVGFDFGQLLSQAIKGDIDENVTRESRNALRDLGSAFAGRGDAASFFGFDNLFDVDLVNGLPDFAPRSAQNARERQEQLDYLEQLRTLSANSLVAPTGAGQFNSALGTSAARASDAQRELQAAADAIKETGDSSPEAAARLAVLRQRLAESQGAASGSVGPLRDVGSAVGGIPFGDFRTGLNSSGPVLTNYGLQAASAAGGVDAFSTALAGVNGLIGQGLTVDPVGISNSAAALVSAIIEAIVIDSPRADFAGAVVAAQILSGVTSESVLPLVPRAAAGLVALIVGYVAAESAEAVLAGAVIAAQILSGIVSESALTLIPQAAASLIALIVGDVAAEAPKAVVAGAIVTAQILSGITSESALALVPQAAAVVAAELQASLQLGLGPVATTVAGRFGDQLKASLESQAVPAARATVDALGGGIAEAASGVRIGFDLNQIFGGTLVSNSYFYGQAVGVNIIQGLIDSFANVGNRAALGVTVGDFVRRTITDFFGNSPAVKGPLSGSGWTLNRGRNIALGLAEGIEAGAGAVDSASRRTAALAALDGSLTRRAGMAAGSAQATLTDGALDGLYWSLEIDPVGFAKIAARGDATRRRR